MKYVLTGGAGHTAKPIAEILLTAGHNVTVISRNASHVQELVEKGATVAIGSVEDPAFLERTFLGADAVYTMIPSNWAATNLKQWIAGIGANYAKAVSKGAVRYVVNLSSIGAHMANGCGPVSGLHVAEEALNNLPGVNIRHIRPGYFYSNFLGSINMIKNMKMMGGNLGEHTKLVLADTSDIANAAAEELLKLGFKGHSVRYVCSDERTTDDIADTFGKVIGMGGLPWVNFSDEQALAGMKDAGIPAEIAAEYVEMGTALRSGEMTREYFSQGNKPTGKMKLEDFARQFAEAYKYT